MRGTSVDQLSEAGERGLVRFWFEFDYGPAPTGISTWNPGPPVCGVTAFDYEDAIRIVKVELFLDRSMPTVKSVIENVDVSTLKELEQPYLYHAPPIWRGVWFPAMRHSGPSVDDSLL
jgi:hypothetical protein